MSKYFIIVLAAVITAAAIWVSVLYAKISARDVVIEETKQLVLERDIIIANADNSISLQNAAIEQLMQSKAESEKRLSSDYEKIKRRYDTLWKDSQDMLATDSSCEQQLKLIYNAQRGFCYE